MKRGILALTAASALTVSAHANDTTAELKTGGLVFTRSGEVEMAEENLYISREQVRVDYVFRNRTDKDVELIVAFPMPDIIGDPEVNISIPDTEVDNFLGFSVTQDGQAIAPQLQQRALSEAGIDLTEELTARGVPLLPFSDEAIEALGTLPEDVAADWTTRGLIVDMGYDDGTGMKHELTPIWTLRSAYYWKTVFPAGRDVHVHHEYTPSVGATVQISFISDGKPSEWNYEDYKTRYCMDDSFIKLATKLSAQSNFEDPSSYYYESWMSYILKTGGNWGGTIGKFHLTIDKGEPNTYISFCGDGVRKTGPTTFEMTAEDFYPEKDLHVLFLHTAQ